MLGGSRVGGEWLVGWWLVLLERCGLMDGPSGRLQWKACGQSPVPVL